MSDLIEYAKKELYLLRDGEEDEMQDLVEKNILELIEVFSKQGHSGFSGNYVLSIFDRLVRYLPITPLTGEDDEWSEPIAGMNFSQNKRCSRVFKDSDGPYDSCVRVFSDDGETFCQNSDSRERIEFPYYPPTYPKKIILENRELEDYEDD